MEPLLGQITLFAGNFAPRGWAYCDGQLLPISQYTALFSILGTTYGGDGRTTFALPDLRGRAPIGPRQGPGLSDYRLGQRGGAENVTLNTTQIPNHTHNLNASPNAGTSATPTGNFIAKHQVTIERGNTVDGESFTPDASGIGPMNPAAISATGGSLSHENRPPYLAINYIIATVGVFPSRN
jgi:microcystin-dependent protein